MILQPSNVKLTKVFYYDQAKRCHNMEVPTISREVYENNFNKNMMIRKNFFGSKWVLQINQSEEKLKKTNRKILLFICVSVCVSIILALCVGLFFSIDYNIFRANNKNTPNNISSNEVIRKNDKFVHQIMIIPKFIKPITNTSSVIEIIKPTHKEPNPYCKNCSLDEVCMKLEETMKPKCVKMKDPRDPTGCGGLCKINTEFCKKLDKSIQVYQCLPLNNRLKCAENSFSCENLCIPAEKRCNGFIDCRNMLDEKNCDCNQTTHFQCGEQTSCLDNNKLCDGKVDCWDKSDELQCQKDIFCQENYIPCLNGQCIPKEKLCDKVFDCIDKTDEPIWCQQTTL